MSQQMIDMVMKMILRKFLNKGINSGIDMATRKGKNPQDMTPEEREEVKRAKDASKNAQRAMRVTRRMGKF